MTDIYALLMKSDVSSQCTRICFDNHALHVVLYSMCYYDSELDDHIERVSALKLKAVFNVKFTRAMSFVPVDFKL